MKKEDYMRRALELAGLGEGYTSPNPMVGCVVVKDGRIIGEGFHERCGEFHAERNALLGCREDPAGADLYVTLEPCCHYGRTPPCTEIILEKKIKRVFVGSVDPNPLVAGKGLQILKEHGIEVEAGILQEACIRLNEVFYHYMQTRTPFVAMKYAMTLDGKIACKTKDSRWVTGEEARRGVQRLRKRYRGIMVGIGTVLADDPLLNCRIDRGADPVRIICDSRLRIPTESRIVQTAAEIPTIVACTRNILREKEGQTKADRLAGAGVQVLPVPGETRIDLRELMALLGGREIDGILLEGGGRLNAAALQAGIVHKVYAYIAGKIVGGEEAPSPVEGVGAERMADAVRLWDTRIDRVGEDFLICGYTAGGRYKGNCRERGQEENGQEG